MLSVNCNVICCSYTRPTWSALYCAKVLQMSQALSSEVTSQGLHALILHLRVDPYTVASIVFPGSCHMLVLSTIHTRVHAYLMGYIWESI